MSTVRTVHTRYLGRAQERRCFRYFHFKAKLKIGRYVTDEDVLKKKKKEDHAGTSCSFTFGPSEFRINNYGEPRENCITKYIAG